MTFDGAIHIISWYLTSPTLPVINPTLWLTKHRHLRSSNVASCCIYWIRGLLYVVYWGAQRGIKYVRIGNLSATLDHRGVHPIESTHNLLILRKLITIIIVGGCFHSVRFLSWFHLLGYLWVQTSHIVFWSSFSLASHWSPVLTIANGLSWTIILLSCLASSYICASHKRLGFHLFHSPFWPIAFPPDEEVETIIHVARFLFLLLILLSLLIFLDCHQGKLHRMTLIRFNFLLN